MELTEQELDFEFSAGFLEGWVKDDPVQVKDHLKAMSDAISFYRHKYLDLQQDYARLLDNYNRLTAQSAQFLQYAQEQKEQMDQMLIEGQRDLHKTE